MKISYLLGAIAGCLLFQIPAGPVHAQSFPAQSVRVVIPYAPGGGTDNLIRPIAPEVERHLGTSLVLENKGGGRAIIGTQTVVSARPDGYTILAGDSSVLINPGLLKDKLPYDTLKSLQGVTMLASGPSVLIINPKVQARTLQELIALAKSKPGQLNYASALGTSNNLAAEVFKLAAGVDIQHIPYGGAGPSLIAVLTGQVDMAIVGPNSARPHIDSGALIALAISGKKRNPALPNVPTFTESGLDVDADTYWGIYAPAGVPPSAIDTLNQAFVKTMRDPAMAAKLADLGYEPIANTPAEHNKQLREMIAKWADVVERAGIKVN